VVQTNAPATSHVGCGSTSVMKLGGYLWRQAFTTSPAASFSLCVCCTVACTYMILLSGLDNRYDNLARIRDAVLLSYRRIFTGDEFENRCDPWRQIQAQEPHVYGR